MNICQKHWDRLREALKERGLEKFGAKTSEDAFRNLVTDLEVRGIENDFDPLMGCNNMIAIEALGRIGLELLRPDESGKPPCPICMCCKLHEDWWIYGPADAMLKEAQDKGLI